MTVASRPIEKSKAAVFSVASLLFRRCNSLSQNGQLLQTPAILGCIVALPRCFRCSKQRPTVVATSPYVIRAVRNATVPAAKRRCSEGSFLLSEGKAGSQ
jgi:hypothetical protein